MWDKVALIRDKRAYCIVKQTQLQTSPSFPRSKVEWRIQPVRSDFHLSLTNSRTHLKKRFLYIPKIKAAVLYGKTTGPYEGDPANTAHLWLSVEPATSTKPSQHATL